ncbi:hypothetical protein CRENBAI_007324 [Crenichthys baileyi]|uniref:Uncharacterized protein n=1 Tax=Crenichthys baileyi TaxID=28760 RepID=A0AAV9S844_9TELE
MTHPHPKALHEWQCDGVGGGRCPGIWREGLGGKMLSQGASSSADPNRPPVRQVPTKVGAISTSTGPKARDRHHAQRTDRKPGPTPPARTAQTLKLRSPVLTPSPPPEEATDGQQKGASRKCAHQRPRAPLQKKEQTSRPNATRICHTKEGI